LYFFNFYPVFTVVFLPPSNCHPELSRSSKNGTFKVPRHRVEIRTRPPRLEPTSCAIPAPAVPSSLDPTDIARLVIAYFRAHKRDMPWRQTRDPYAIWVSEIMLQQTRVAAVIPYYQRWMKRFPTVRALAEAPLDDVLAAWSGLGYYSRARNLHRGAQHVIAHSGGALPQSIKELRAIPGIGAYTAGAIASIAFDMPEPLVDGNVARVLARLHALEGDIKSSATTRTLWRLAAELVPERAPGDFNQGLMELGATVCTPARPSCLVCPLRDSCRAHAAGRERELPRTPARKPAHSLPLIDARALWITHEDRVLLARRAPHGLYGGLWELPQADDADELDALLPGARLASEPALEHRQTLSHRRLRIRVYPATLPDSRNPGLRGLGKQARERYDRVAWHPLAQSRGVSAATQSIMERLLGERLWRTILANNFWKSE
jgi:A/G-specific adenine glycosylase